MEKKIIYTAAIWALTAVFSASAWYYSWIIHTNAVFESLISRLELDLKKEREKNIILTQLLTKQKDEQILQRNNSFENMDFETDDSLQKFLNPENGFNNKKYIPQSLERISSNVIYDSKWWNQVLRKEAKDALEEMWKKFEQETWEKINVVSAYRSYDYQVWIKKWWCPDNLCANPGFSEHQTGLVVDLWSASSKDNWYSNVKLKKYFSWLNENAYKFGFHNTYQKWRDVDWYEIEPWHWRYLWVELATYLRENNLTFAEFYKEKTKNEKK